MRRVIINFARVGDMVLMIPALRLLARDGPLELVGRPWAQEVLGGQSFLTRIHTIAHPYRGHQLHDRWLYGGMLARLADTLSRGGFDEILVFKQESPKIIRWMRGWAGTTPVRVLDSSIRPGGSPHPVDIYRDCLREAGLDVSAFDPRPMLTVDPEMGRRMRARVDALGKRVISLQSGSSLINRWWWKRRPNLRGLTTAQWAALLARLLREGDADAIILHGAHREGPQARAVRAAMPLELQAQVHDWTGHADLTQLPGIFARVRAILTVDTGPAHIAAAVGCPALVVFGPSDPRRWQPRGPGPVEPLLGSAPCQFCNETPLIKKCRNNICLNRLSDEFIHDAWKRLRSRLPAEPPSAAP
jgi:ADP-heptose:LPS heptosyltransferase